MPDTERAIFAAGCFWHVEAAFCKVNGVVSTRVGYTGGTTQKPSYEDVCSGETGHAESVEVQFDPDRVSYDDLLNVFWKIHDPTLVNRQGPDVGEQYRSAVFYTSEEQKMKALASKEKLAKSKNFKRPIATQIEAAGTFWPAEEYHQKYFEKHKMAACGI